jgi:hypothetical protein
MTAFFLVFWNDGYGLAEQREKKRAQDDSVFFGVLESWL